MEVQLRSAGRHQVGNAVAAAAAAAVLGLEPAVDRRRADRGRVPVAVADGAHRRTDGVVVVNDAYNANPDSMRAALDTLAELGRSSGGRTWAVLGDMLELGADAPARAPRDRAVVADARGSTVLVALGDVRRPSWPTGARGVDGAGACRTRRRWRPGSCRGSAPATSSWSRRRVA